MSGEHKHDFSWQVCHNEKCALYMHKDTPFDRAKDLAATIVKQAGKL